MTFDMEGHFRKWYVRPKPGRALVVGSRVVPGRKDARRLFPDAFGVDLEPGRGVDLVHDMEEPLSAQLGLFDHVMCVSVLEHARRPWKVAETIERAMVDSGTLFVSVPTVWRFHAYPHDYWRFLKGSLDILFPSVVWQQRLYYDEDGTIGKKDRIPTLEDKTNIFGKVMLCAFGEKRT